MPPDSRAVLSGLALIAGLLIPSGYFALHRQVSEAPVIGMIHETEIRISAEVTGRLSRVVVREGQEVRKGDLLAVLSNPELAASAAVAGTELEAARADLAHVVAGVREEQISSAAEVLAIARSNLTLAEQQHSRVSTLAIKDFASRQQLDDSSAEVARARAALDSAQAILDQSHAGPTKETREIAEEQVALARAARADLQARLDKTTITAPADGIVRLLIAEPGEILATGQPVMTLAPLHDAWFAFTLRETRLSGLTVGSPIRLVTAAGDRVEARVTEMRPLGEFAVWRAARATGDHDINSFLVRAEPIAAATDVEPGMSVWLDAGPAPTTEALN
jgi:multidrug resistance efflux pump